MSSSVENPLAEFFSCGVEAADIQALFPLLRAREALSAFITLFRGGDDEVLIRLLVLRDIGARSNAPRWSPQDLRDHFAYLDAVKLDTVLQRLRKEGLLRWDEQERLYQVSSVGRTALAAIATLLQFSQEEDAELGYITAQVAAGQAVGKISTEALHHLLGRLNELQSEFEQAIVSGSEFRIRDAEQRLSSVWHWVEKGTDIVRAIAADANLDTPTHQIAQAIGQAQGRIMRLNAMFQRALNQIDKQKVHLGASGLSSSNINEWLRALPLDRLNTLLESAIQYCPEPAFLLTDVVADQAEYELLERVRLSAEETTLPSPSITPEIEAAEGERLQVLENWLPTLQAIDAPCELAEIIIGGTYSQAAYRLSLLALLNDTESRAMTGPVADLARLPLILKIDNELTPIKENEVAEMSGGEISPRSHASEMAKSETTNTHS